MFKHFDTLKLYVTSMSQNEKSSSISLTPENEAWDFENPET